MIGSSPHSPHSSYPYMLAPSAPTSIPTRKVLSASLLPSQGRSPHTFSIPTGKASSPHYYPRKEGPNTQLSHPILPPHFNSINPNSYLHREGSFSPILTLTGKAIPTLNPTTTPTLTTTGKAHSATSTSQ